ncbi:TPA_asm: SET [Leatherback sea turtle adomavirus]|nr:TPA_asm: SET [Leatherback sea turtle adomavirus]
MEDLQQKEILQFLDRRDWEKNLVVNRHHSRGNILKTSVCYRKGEWVLPYEGEIISEEEANRREKIYAAEGSECCLFHFTDKEGKKHVIDPTELQVLGKYISHARNPNLTPIYKHLSGFDYVIFKASRLIEAGEELFFCYFPGQRPRGIPWSSFRTVSSLLQLAYAVGMGQN